MIAGRPTKYDPKYCEMLIEHMSEGYTLESFAGKIGVCRDTLYEWINVHSQFSDTVKRARQLQLQANEKLLRDIAKGKIKNANSAAAIFIMKNCHRWTDRNEIKIEDVSQKTAEELKKEAAALLGVKLED